MEREAPKIPSPPRRGERGCGLAFKEGVFGTRDPRNRYKLLELEQRRSSEGPPGIRRGLGAIYSWGRLIWKDPFFFFLFSGPSLWPLSSPP
jgi:hypothetical protein